MNGKLLLSPNETARALGIGRTLVYDLMRDGQLGSLKVGRLRKIPISAIEQWITEAQGAGYQRSAPASQRLKREDQ